MHNQLQQFKGRLSLTDIGGNVARGAGELAPAVCVAAVKSDRCSSLFIITDPFWGQRTGVLSTGAGETSLSETGGQRKFTTKRHISRALLACFLILGVWPSNALEWTLKIRTGHFCQTLCSTLKHGERLFKNTSQCLSSYLSTLFHLMRFECLHNRVCVPNYGPNQIYISKKALDL